ncbi:FAD-binding domain-containing protein [Roridomyces roridus]|uniref:FAD-binding domain-containing protein n=1 Tax=Roridomyces roridus TaxID=1738132 RepID=A0AAD7F7Y6_9AGAR|nr:FAD-binding domain-containing protein [Roridomyces roridus]
MRSLTASILFATAVSASSSVGSSACTTLSSSLSTTANVYHPNSTEYTLAIEHWLLSSTESPQCVVEPRSSADIAQILQIVNATQTPFAVKGGGHSSNVGFSSTTGVHISLAQFNYTVLDVQAETVAIGAGSKWIDVYTILDGTGFNVVGGRNPAVGVAGFTLGGGYSWKTNAHGLAIDNLVKVNIVLPNGTATTVSATQNPDLFFSLKGGFNNFGIVTEFTFHAIPQDLVHGGHLTYDFSQMSAVNAALVAFEQNNKDTRAAVVGGISSLPTANGTLGAPAPGVQIFYDGAELPDGMFADFLAIPTVSSDWTGQPITFLEWSGLDGGVSNLRGLFHAFSTLPHTTEFLQDVVDEVADFSAELTSKSAVYMSVAIEPFMAGSLSNDNATARSSAYPPIRSPVLLPSNIFFGYTDATEEETFRLAIARIQSNIVSKAAARGLILPQSSGGGIYPNYALGGADGAHVLEFYGEEHLERMRRVRREVDPTGVMRLAGGWKV